MDTQPTNSTGSRPNAPPPSPPSPPSSPPSDSDDEDSTNPPPPEENPPNNTLPKSLESSPSPPSSEPSNQSPQTTSQDLREDLPPSPPSQESPQNSPAPPISTQPINLHPAPPSFASEKSPPSPPSDNFSLSGSQPSPLSSGPPPGGQLTSNPPTLSPPSPSLTSLVLKDTPTINGSNNVLEKSESNGGGIRTIGLVAIGVVFGMVLVGVIGLTVWWLRRKMKVVSEAGLPTSLGASNQSDYALRKMLSSSANALVESGHESANGSSGLGNSRNWFSYEDLVRVTNEFSVSNLLGEGGFGSVFKGRLKDGREVAVKQLKDGGGQGEREFRAEVETISCIHHRHLVSLVGYCISDDKRLLVYDYVPNNTLHFHLHGKSEPVLDWPTRIKIATGAARGIAYLHTDCHPRIIHRDIKSSNILLDNNFEAQVSDFGLARWFSDINTHVTTRVMGTFGYMAPEYALSGKLTEKSDVFSFGVVLLELVTGRKPVDSSQPPGEESLVEWARPLLNDALDKEEFEKLVDPRLENNYVDSEMFRAIEAAAACVQYSALKRPKMSQILRAFDDMSVSDLTNGMRVGESEIVDAARKSAEMRLFQRMAFGSQDYSTSFFMQSDFKSGET